MVPEVDKKDTEQLLRSVRETAEAVRQEVQSWTLPKEQTTNDAEAQAVRRLAARSAQQARQWTGQLLAELGSDYPNPNSPDGTTQTIDRTAVPVAEGLDFPGSYTVVQRIKGTRSILSSVKADLSNLLEQCLVNTDFTYCLRTTQQHVKQTAMWLGELLHEFYEAQPKVEALAPEKEAASTTTNYSTPTTPDSDPSTPDSPAPTQEASNSLSFEAVAPGNDASPSTSLPTVEPSTATTTSGSGSKPTSPSVSEPSGSKPKTSGKHVRK